MKLDRIKPCEPAAFASDLAMYCLIAGEYGARFMAATAEATKAAQRAGIEQAKASGERYKGRKPSSRASSSRPCGTCWGWTKA